MARLMARIGGVDIPVPRGPRGEDGILVGESKVWNGVRLPAGYLWEDGSAVSRVTYDALFDELTIQTTGTTTSGSVTITGVASTADIKNGWPISGPGIPAGAVVIGTGVNSITISVAATASAVGVDLVIAPHGVGDGVTTFNLPDKRLRTVRGSGAGLTIGTTDALAEASRLAYYSHDHDHLRSGSITLTKTGGVSAGASNIALANHDTNHNHSLSGSDHGVATNTATTGGANRATGGAHGSSALQAQSSIHGHVLTADSHGHGDTINFTVNDTIDFYNEDSGTHPYATVNYIIKY